MGIITAAYTDIGIKRASNQDSVLLEMAETDYGQVILTVLCDGMGGLSKGEVASATLVNGFAVWFEKEFPYMLYAGISADKLKTSWEKVVNDINERIANYAQTMRLQMGTTLVVLLLVGERYYAMHVGDSRIYMLSDEIVQLTKDQTFVQREMDAGRMTEEQAKTDPQRNALLQCVGASDVIVPEFQFGEIVRKSTFVLCSDGFRHVVTAEEIYTCLNPHVVGDEAMLQNSLVYLTELNKSRNETDNISVTAICTN